MSYIRGDFNSPHQPTNQRKSSARFQGLFYYVCLPIYKTRITMNALMTVVFTLFTIFLVAFGAPVSPRDVFVPPLTSPKAGAVLKVGHTYEITW